MHKYQKLLIAIIATIVLIILVLFISIIFNLKKPDTEPIAVPSVKPGLVPQTKFENEAKNIRIDYSQGTNAYWVYIESSSVEDYIQNRKEAVEQLKKMGVDTCDINKTFWPLPAEIKSELKGNDLDEIRKITCPKPIK